MFLKYEFSHIIVQVYLNYRFESFCMKKFQSSITSTKQVIISAQYYFSLQSAKNNLMIGLWVPKFGSLNITQIVVGGFISYIQ